MLACMHACNTHASHAPPCAAHWSNLKREIEQAAGGGGRAVAVHAATCCEKWASADGIDLCGQRLAAEVQKVVNTLNPQGHPPRFQYISFVGHSMGGLIVRYAIGRLYNPAAGTLAGLQPRLYLSLATPHLGLSCEENAAQVRTGLSCGDEWGRW
jgi:hypothetical protein